jgi:hypothetical protein
MCQKVILERIQRKCSSFLWLGSKEKEGIPLVKWTRITNKKEHGGWGLKNYMCLDKHWLQRVFGGCCCNVPFQIGATEMRS